jgi:hypothetical protein
MNLLYLKKISVFILFLLFCFTTFSQINYYPINQTLNAVGQKTFDVDNDGTVDYTFDIILLSPNVYAARVNAMGASKILDNSTFGYPDTLNFNDPVIGFFHSGIGVLGTFNNAGQFNGAGMKYLGIKINSGSSDYLGWIKLYCSSNRDTLKIISCGYNVISGAAINAGQTIISGLKESNTSFGSLELFPNPCSNEITIIRANSEQINYSVFNSTGQEVMKGKTSNKINISNLQSGLYTLKVYNTIEQKSFKVIKE